jgi:ABC-type xylose transport system substrate-binding protein
MTWPFVTRKVFDLSITAQALRVAAAEQERDYWRTRAEKLMDQALARAGAISEPTMRDAVVRKDPSLAAGVIAAMNITEIGKQSHPAGETH